MTQERPGSYLLFSLAVLLIGATAASLLFRATTSFSLLTSEQKTEPIAAIEPSTTPAVRTVITDNLQKVVVDKELLQSKLALKSKAFVIKDLDTGESILEKNSETAYPIASVTKLMTAMIAIDNIPADDSVTISRRAYDTYGHQGSLLPGEKFKASDLINCLLLESSNDAAEALAEHYGRDQFLALMNSQAKSLGMTHTHYEDPSGLSKNNVSTPEDLSTLISYIQSRRQDIMAITKKRSYKIAASKLSHAHLWLNENRLIRENNAYYIGGKDGFTGDALMTFTGAFSIPIKGSDAKRFSIALLKSSDKNSDVSKIIDRLIKSLKYGDGSPAAAVSKNVKPESRVSLAIVGNIFTNRLDPPPLENISFLRDDDILFGSVGGPVSLLGYDVVKPSLKISPDIIKDLSDMGFDALAIATSHIGDRGITAVEDTINGLRQAGIAPVGGGLNGADASQVRVVEKNGIKIGFLAFSDDGPDWLIAKQNLPTILSVSDPHFDTIIQAAAKTVDHLVVAIDFKSSAGGKISERERTLGHRVIDDGARIVAGYSAGAPAETEDYGGGVIAYNLGDLFATSSSQNAAVLEATLDKKQVLEAEENMLSHDQFNRPTASN